MANNGSLLSGSPGSVFSSRLVRFFVFIIIACVALLTYQVWVLTNRCGMYESRMLSYDAQLHRLEDEKSTADKRANSYRQQAIQLKDTEGKLIRKIDDSRKELEGARQQMAEVKVSENKAQQALETAKNMVNERNEFLSKRETTCRSDISQLMRDLESCKNKLTPYQIHNSDLRHSKPLEYIGSQKNNTSGGSQETKQPGQESKNQEDRGIVSSKNNSLPEEKERAIQVHQLGQNELLIQKLRSSQNVQPIQEQQSGQNVQPMQEQQFGQNVQPIQEQRLGQNIQPIQEQRAGQNVQPIQEQRAGQNVQPIQEQQPGENVQQNQPGQFLQPIQQQQAGWNVQPIQEQRLGQNDRSIQEQQNPGQNQVQGQGQQNFGAILSNQGSNLGQEQIRSEAQLQRQDIN